MNWIELAAKLYLVGAVVGIVACVPALIYLISILRKNKHKGGK